MGRHAAHRIRPVDQADSRRSHVPDRGMTENGRLRGGVRAFLKIARIVRACFLREPVVHGSGDVREAGLVRILPEAHEHGKGPEERLGSESFAGAAFLGPGGVFGFFVLIARPDARIVFQEGQGSRRMEIRSQIPVRRGRSWGYGPEVRRTDEKTQERMFARGRRLAEKTEMERRGTPGGRKVVRRGPARRSRRLQDDAQGDPPVGRGRRIQRRPRRRVRGCRRDRMVIANGLHVRHGVRKLMGETAGMGFVTAGHPRTA